jgi:sodium-coupled neutral amino acid transporter 11
MKHDSTSKNSTKAVLASTNKKRLSVEQSPFFYPSDPRLPRQQQIVHTTPRGTTTTSVVHSQKHQLADDEHKTGVFGTVCNLVVGIIGAGIVGIPYAIKKSGLVAGLIMTILSAVACDKSLRLLIETAKHVDVTSYETLFEAAFGARGFKTMCAIMFVMSYGAMVSYLMIIKDMLSMILGIDPDNEPMRRAAMVIATLAVALPLSSQRDVADLSKTSRLSVLCYICIVLFVAMCSPVTTSLQSNGGWYPTVTESIIRPDTFFAGFGVLTFAFVCQHSAFILAGSLERPTRDRWAKVTHLSLTFSGTLAVVCGVAGYLAFLDQTNGNVLLNMERIQSTNYLLGPLNKVAQVMLLICMFFVYPMDAFVLRHVSMVLLFKGRAAHDGIDHLVLARPDRRILLTMALYMVTLLPALLLQNLGSVLSVTGSVAASALSYICPGASYLAVHGAEFKKLVSKNWTWGNPDCKLDIVLEFQRHRHGNTTTEQQSLPTSSSDTENDDASSLPNKRWLLCCWTAMNGTVQWVLGRTAWYLCLMPIWMAIANYGQSSLLEYAEQEATKSPLPIKPLGKISHKRILSDRAKGLHTPDFIDITRDIVGAVINEKSPLLQMDLKPHPLTEAKKSYSIPVNLDSTTLEGGTLHNISIPNNKAILVDKSKVIKPAGGVNRAIGAAIASANAAAAAAALGASEIGQETVVDEEDPQSDFPTLYDFVVAIFFITLGAIAMVAGLYSVFAP